MTEPIGIELKILDMYCLSGGSCIHEHVWSQYVATTRIIDRTKEPLMISRYNRYLCHSCATEYAKLIATAASPHAEVLRDISLSLKHIVAHLDKNELSTIVISKVPVSK